MTNLIVQKKKKENLFNLRVVTNNENFPSLVDKKEEKITLISEEKTYYLYLDKESEGYGFHSVYEFFTRFASNNDRSINIEVNSFINSSLNEELALQAIIEGILFGSHQTVSYKSNKQKEKSESISYYLVTDAKQSKQILENSQVKLEAVNFARDLQDSPPNKLNSKEFVQEIKDKFKEFPHVKVKILDKSNIEKNKMGLLLAVNKGSHHDPYVVVLSYEGNKKDKEVLGLVGKGITFDSGGYNLKPSSALQCMKFDMSGAAVVCSAFLSIAKQKPKINVVAVACLTENAIGGHATLTESVVTSMSGKTVEINNTDAEGRLVLADGITYAIKKEKVSKIITVATLTGAVVAALGENTTGIFSNDCKFYNEFLEARRKSQEKVWELPIWPENVKALKENTSIADVSNISGGKYMGASSGAAFLREFVGKLPFIHCDIAGTAWKTKAKRGTGVMTKTLIEIFQD